MWLRVAIPVLIAAAISCGRKSEPGLPAATVAAFSFAEGIGWLHGPCLAITNASLARGTPVALVIMAEPQAVQPARIQEPTNSPAACQALMEGRGAVNAKPGMTFYTLEAAGLASTDMGFGIIAPPANPVVVNGMAQADLDRDGHSEVFSSCATSEGIKFAVWTGQPYRGEPRWSGYYYMDYDTKSTCP